MAAYHSPVRVCSRLYRIRLVGLVYPTRNVLKLHQRFFLPGKRLRAPRIHSRILKLQPHLSFLLRSWFADPYHVALRSIHWVFVWDDFDNLSAFQSESPMSLNRPGIKQFF